MIEMTDDQKIRYWLKKRRDASTKVLFYFVRHFLKIVSAHSILRLNPIKKQKKKADDGHDQMAHHVIMYVIYTCHRLAFTLRPCALVIRDNPLWT